ncbi:MAG: redoxin domain-containing protein [Bacteroidales bacterium]|nr:redoxin domain-containing protein [Bacteroidales bacterium]
MKNKILMAFAFWSFLCGCSLVKDIDVDAFAQAASDGARVLDVRTPAEYEEGYIPGAANVDWNGEGFISKVDAIFDGSAPLYIYCRSGRRSAAAGKALVKAGYEVFNLIGGYEAWTAAGKRIDQDAKYAASLIPAGESVPDFELNDIDGKAVKLSDFRGKSVVLVFWASWCPDCRAEIPELKAMYADADPAKVEFVSVSFDREFEALRSFVAENELPGVQLFDPAGKKESKVGADFGVKWIPSLYLIDAEGKVLVSTVMAWKIADALNGSIPVSSRTGALCSDESCAL